MMANGGTMKINKLLLFLLPLLFFIPKNTYAASLDFLDSPDLMFHYTANTYEASRLEFGPYNDFGTQTFGYNFSADGQRYGIGYYFNDDSRYHGKSFNIDFVVFNRIKSDKIGLFTTYLRDDNQNITSCNVKSISSLDFEKLYPLSGQPGGETVEQDFADTGIFSTVTCENVTVNSGFDIVFSGPFQSHGIFAISNIHVKENSSSSIQGAIAENTEQNKKTNDLIENTDTSDSQTKGANFFKDYNSNAHGLSGIITAPLKFLQSLTGAKCNPLKFNLPFVKKEVQLQCMKSIYQNHFGVFYTLWQTITTGLIAYTVCLNFYKKIRDLQNPNNDKIEVLNL